MGPTTLIISKVVVAVLCLALAGFVLIVHWNVVADNKNELYIRNIQLTKERIIPLLHGNLN